MQIEQREKNSSQGERNKFALFKFLLQVMFIIGKVILIKEHHQKTGQGDNLPNLYKQNNYRNKLLKRPTLNQLINC